MSRNSKSARLTAQRHEWSAIRKGGGSGPKRTTPKHGKVNTYAAKKRVLRMAQQQ